MKRGSHMTLSEINYHVTKIVEPAVIPRLYNFPGVTNIDWDQNILRNIDLGTDSANLCRYIISPPTNLISQFVKNLLELHFSRL